MKNPLVLLTVCFSSGIVFAYLFKIHFWLVYILGFMLIFVSLLFIQKGLSFCVLSILSIFILGALHFENTYSVSRSCVSRHLDYNDGNIYTLKGFVNNNPGIQNGRIVFIFRIEELQFDKSRYKSCGDILVYAKDTNALFYGDELILLGKIKKPYRVFKPGISAVMHVQSNSALVRLNKNKGSLVKRTAFYLKNKIESVLFKHLSPLTAGIVDAMVLGEKKHIPPIIYDVMVKSGTVHILVVSGFNVGIIIFMAGLFFKILRIPRKPRYILVIISLILYCFITGASTPVVRATVMGVFLILGYLLKKEPDITNSFFLAFLFIILADPKSLFSISFQLSFMSVAAIVYLYPRLRSFFKLEGLKLKPLKFILEGSLVSFSAWVGIIGLVAYYFKIISPVTLLANIFVIPIATLITLSGLSMVIVVLILPFLAGPFAATNEVLVITLLKVNTFFITLPFAYLYL